MAVTVSAVMHAGRLRQEMVRRGWAASDLAREARLSQATISSALAGRAIAAQSVSLIARALLRTPVIEGIDSLILGSDTTAELG